MNDKIMQNVGLALVPFSPVPLTGQDALYSWGRIALYGGLAYGFRNNKALSYTFGAMGVISLLSSLSSTAWKEKEAKETAQAKANMAPAQPVGPGMQAPSFTTDEEIARKKSSLQMPSNILDFAETSADPLAYNYQESAGPISV